MRGLWEGFFVVTKWTCIDESSTACHIATYVGSYSAVVITWAMGSEAHRGRRMQLVTEFGVVCPYRRLVVPDRVEENNFLVSAVRASLLDILVRMAFHPPGICTGKTLPRVLIE